MSCKCGGIIYADTEDWETPLCYYCYDKIDQTDRLTILEQENKILVNAMTRSMTFTLKKSRLVLDGEILCSPKTFIEIDKYFTGMIEALEKVKGLND